MTPEQASALRAPFKPEQIGKLPKPTRRENPKGKCPECKGYHGLPAVHLDYVGHAAITDRFLQVDPTWTWEPMAVDAQGLPLRDSTGGLWINLTLCGVTRPGYGDETNGKGMKEIIGDALRNGGMRFGVGLDLWSKEDLSASGTDIDDAGEKPKPAPKAKASETISAAQLTRLHTLVGVHGLSSDSARTLIRDIGGVESSKDIPAAKYDAIIAEIQKVPVAA